MGQRQIINQIIIVGFRSNRIIESRLDFNRVGCNESRVITCLDARRVISLARCHRRDPSWQSRTRIVRVSVRFCILTRRCLHVSRHEDRQGIGHVVQDNILVVVSHSWWHLGCTRLEFCYNARVDRNGKGGGCRYGWV